MNEQETEKSYDFKKQPSVSTLKIPELNAFKYRNFLSKSKIILKGKTNVDHTIQHRVDASNFTKLIKKGQLVTMRM